MKKIPLVATITLISSILVLPTFARAAPSCMDGASMQETQTSNLYDGCWPELYTWVWKAYALTDDTFQAADNGFLDACNEGRPFGKMVNAAYAINYVLSDNYLPQWHSTSDYENASKAFTNFHGPYYSRLIIQNDDTPSALASSNIGRFAARDQIDYHCGLFNANGAWSTVVERAASIVHEAWHHWQKAKNYDVSHPSCPGRGGDCDYYYWHGSGAFDFGQLNNYTRDGRLFHSPYQVMAEFESDLAEQSKGSTPISLTQDARQRANNRLSGNFVNPISWRVGQPRPF